MSAQTFNRRRLCAVVSCLLAAAIASGADKAGLFGALSRLAESTGPAGQAGIPQPQISPEQMQLLLRMLADREKSEQFLKIMQSAAGQAVPQPPNGQMSADQARQLLLLLQGAGAATAQPGGPAAAMQAMSQPHPAPGLPAVIVRQDGRQAPISPSKRETRFVVSQADVFADVVKAELVAAAVSLSAEVAQQQLYRSLSGQINKIGAHIPLAGGRVIGRLGGHVLSSQRNKQRGFEFDYLKGIRSAMELTATSPVELLITAPTAFTALDPVLVKTDVLSKEAIRVLVSRKVELRASSASPNPAGVDRELLKVEKNTPAVQIQKNPDGTILLRSATALEPGEYALAFQAGDKEAFALLDNVYEFRVAR